MTPQRRINIGTFFLVIFYGIKPFQFTKLTLKLNPNDFNKLILP